MLEPETPAGYHDQLMWQNRPGFLGKVQDMAANAFIGAAFSFAMLSTVSADSLRVYVGTYTGGENGSKGIYRTTLDLQTGELAAPVLAAKAASPSFLAIHPGGKFLYAVCEAGRTGRVFAYAVSPDTGDLTLLNECFLARIGSVPHQCRSRGEIRAGRELRQRQRRGDSHSAGWRARRSDRFRPARGLQRESFASEGAACPFDQSQPGRPIRLCGRPRASTRS